MPQADDCRLYSPRKFNATTKQRFKRARLKSLVAHCGSPSNADLILIKRIIENEWELMRQDARMDDDSELSANAIRARMGMENRLRLDLRDLGKMGGAAQKPASIAEQLAALTAKREGAVAA